MNDTTNYTIDNPIAFFRNLLFYDGIKDLLQQFENDADVLGANYDEANSILWYYEVNDDTSLSYLLMKKIRLKKIILPINHLFNYNDKLFKKSYI